MNSAVFL